MPPRRKKKIEKTPAAEREREVEEVPPVMPSSVPGEAEGLEIDAPARKKEEPAGEEPAAAEPEKEERPSPLPEWEGEAGVEEPAADPKRPAKRPGPPVIHVALYRNIAATFAVATALILVFVLYLAFARATITVVPRKTPVSAEITVTVKPVPQGDEIAGAYEETTIQKTKTLPITGEGKVEESQASGTVTLINLTSRDQPLVATTRLLSEGGVLFRLKNQVRVPGNGRIDAEVYADKPGASGNIEPAKFTIPGLNPTLQQSIYAVSTAPMTGGVRTVKVVTEADIAAAVETVEKELVEEATATLRALAGEAAAGGGELINHEVTTRTTTSAIGTEASTVEVTVGIRASGVFYDRAALEERAAASLRSSVTGGQELVSFDPGAIQVSVDRSDAAAGTATLRVTAAGTAAVDESSDIFDRAKLAGLSAKGVTEYFKRFPEIEAASVRFRPSWLRRVPNLKDHIDVIIVR